jgi:hypothetical protein
MRLARDRSHLWSGYELANALQLSILGVVIGGVSLSIAYYDVYLTLFGMTYALRRILTSATAEESADPSHQFVQEAA